MLLIGYIHFAIVEQLGLRSMLGHLPPLNSDSKSDSNSDWEDFHHLDDSVADNSALNYATIAKCSVDGDADAADADAADVDAIMEQEG